MSPTSYPHVYAREVVCRGAMWDYRCRCGLGSPRGGKEGDDCPAALRDALAAANAERDEARAILASLGPDPTVEEAEAAARLLMVAACHARMGDLPLAGEARRAVEVIQRRLRVLTRERDAARAGAK